MNNMESFVIPQQPDSLYFVIKNMWNGAPAPEQFHTEMWLSQTEKGLVIRVHGTMLPHARIPSSPRDKRTDRLWEQDVVELFLVGEDGTYLEIELGPSGHWLVLGFSGVRQRANDYMDFNPDHRNSSLVAKTWQSIITIPWDMVPRPLARLNAFAILEGQHLALHPVPGNEPDFHQPQTYPSASIAQQR